MAVHIYICILSLRPDTCNTNIRYIAKFAKYEVVTYDKHVCQLTDVGSNKY